LFLETETGAIEEAHCDCFPPVKFLVGFLSKVVCLLMPLPEAARLLNLARLSKDFLLAAELRLSADPRLLVGPRLWTSAITNQTSSDQKRDEWECQNVSGINNDSFAHSESGV
jgi:hypothetical protein